MIEQDILKYSNLNRIELLHSKESNSTNEENAYYDGYRKPLKDIRRNLQTYISQRELYIKQRETNNTIEL